MSTTDQAKAIALRIQSGDMLDPRKAPEYCELLAAELLAVLDSKQPEPSEIEAELRGEINGLRYVLQTRELMQAPVAPWPMPDFTPPDGTGAPSQPEGPTITWGEDLSAGAEP